MPERVRPQPIEQPKYVSYMDLSGGLNTRKDPHALARNQLATSVNMWQSSGNAISVRPGTAALSGGATGSGNHGTGIATAQFAGVTYVIEQQGTALYYTPSTGGSWTSLGTLGAAPNFIQVAQMYDPDNTTAAGTTAFIVDGVDTPKTWLGPTHALGTVQTAAGFCPVKQDGVTPITPKYVTTVGFYLVYANDPTEPTAVYISNPYFPERFNISTVPSNSAPPPYNSAGIFMPQLVGWNDGVNGGDITGVRALFSSIMVYKQSAIYRFDQIGLLGQTFWQSTLVSASVGCLSPKSIVSFDTFHCFLGIDGVYQTDGINVRRVSDNVPTLFDGSLSGFPAAIQDRTSAIGVRSGQRYLIFYDSGGV